MTKLANAYQMLQTCFIKTGTIVVVHEEFTAGKVYAAKDIPEARLKVWIQEGFCVPAVSGEKVTAVATPDEKAIAADKTAKKKAEAVAEEAEKKAEKAANKKAKEKAEADKKVAKKATEENKKKTAAEERKKAAAEKKANAEKALKEEAEREKAEAELEAKAVADAKVEAEAEKEAEAERLAPLFDLWANVSVEDYQKYVNLAKEGGYELDDAPDTSDPAAWLAYFVPFFGEDGPPPLPEIEAE